MTRRLKLFTRKLMHRSYLARRLVGWFYTSTGKTSDLDVTHLSTYRDADALGPLQQPEALLLFAIVKTLVPMTIVEFGFRRGHSAFNFLKAMAPQAQLFSYDIADESVEVAAEEFSRYRNFHFLLKSQTDFSPSDIGHQPVDIVFFDASHDLEANRQTFEAIYPSLTKHSVVCIHDTGLWSKEHFLDVHRDFIELQSDARWVGESLYAHQNDERIFVNWILRTYPGFQAVHFHSIHALRHGLSVLQQTGELETAKEVKP